jgi:DNA invertase Pin-like site-specific DNA recombinase
VHIFREKGVSGTTDTADRPAWRSMLAEILADGVRAIVIERLDRLARDLMVQEYIIADCQKRGIVLLSTAEPDLCSSDPTRVLMRQILGAIAAYDKSMIVLKLRGARERKRAQSGRCEGAKPYGELPGEQDTLSTAYARCTLREPH